MKIYLAVTNIVYLEDLIPGSDILSSYVYLKKETGLVGMIPSMRNFILDSGVFTMINSGKKFDLDSYVDEYADFVRTNKIKNYVELDVDQIIGVEKTRKLRDRLESKVGWRSIPVWHTIRGKESFIQDCKDYEYIALGYFLTEGLKADLTAKYAKAFVDKAHSLNCRIHGLGFTRFEHLKKIPFDSVDSSSWAASRRFGIWFKFDANNGCVTQFKPKNSRMPSAAKAGRPAFIEWKKYQDWAYTNLMPLWN